MGIMNKELLSFLPALRFQLRELPDPMTALIVGIILVVLGLLAAGISWLVRKNRKK